MKIETKYDIGQEVWCLIKGEPYKVEVICIKFAYGQIYYDLLFDYVKVFELAEYALFPTKEELLKSL